MHKILCINEVRIQINKCFENLILNIKINKKEKIIYKRKILNKFKCNVILEKRRIFKLYICKKKTVKVIEMSGLLFYKLRSKKRNCNIHTYVFSILMEVFLSILSRMFSHTYLPNWPFTTRLADF